MHCREKEKGPTLHEWRAVEQREHLAFVGHSARDGGVGDSAVALNRVGEGPEVLAERLVSVHAGPSGLEAGGEERADGPEEEPQQDERAHCTHAVDHPALTAEAPGGQEDAGDDDRGHEAPEQGVGQ
jgi:hypothetical protein